MSTKIGQISPGGCYAIATSRAWHEKMVENLRRDLPDINWVLINTEKDFALENLRNMMCRRIFIPHWSKIIPEDVLREIECVVFHMTDLPYGRGGSPLQNLIVRGHKSTKISALRAGREIDAGPIYLKDDLDLSGTAHQIFLRSSAIIENMIIKIVRDNIAPTPQVGEPIHFKRRKPSDGNIVKLETINEIYDYIRMMDCPGYPPAFLESDNFVLEFVDAKFGNNGELHAKVTFVPRK